MRASGTPQYARCAPTPSGTTNVVVPVLHRDDGRVVEVVVVIVRDDHRVDRRQLGERDAAARTSAAGRPSRQRRGALAPDRIGEHAVAVDLDQHRRVAEPGDAQAGRGRRREARAGRSAPRAAAARGLASGLAWNIAVIAPQMSFDSGCGFSKWPSLPLRRALHARAALADGAVAERLPAVDDRRGQARRPARSPSPAVTRLSRRRHGRGVVFIRAMLAERSPARRCRRCRSDRRAP